MTPCVSSSFSLDVPPLPPVDISPLVSRDWRKKGKKDQRRVSFFPKVSIQQILHRHDYSTLERQRTWLTLDELKSMKRKSLRLALALSSNPDSAAAVERNDDDDDDDDRWCIRGLEGRTRQGLRKRKRVKNAARDAVLWEQGLQRKWGVSIDDFGNGESILADAYYERTECAQIEAHMVGLRDAEEAERILAVSAEAEFASEILPAPSAGDRPRPPSRGNGIAAVDGSHRLAAIRPE
eukprot:CAMPEP_0197177778 /NCGR_PEP_ID=MMETSP1423-20130617/3263_1 /TAXON_ID=476441 /ORGANISM="Pseudo-nitzschia heimii, Strain UNC1101" /LENGTH=236 /DNA_ID=CAMNT_0042627383 /DNA_START=107 /DNA_END=817 /DNA_ORIENTATION=-